jgi:DNA primase
LHQAGFTNAVSPMGTALTEHQFYLLKRLSKRIILALDPDAAGDKATLRGLQVARESMDHDQDPVFNVRGLLGFETRLQADIRVTTLPAGVDPDDIVNRDPREWEGIVKNAKPIVVHVMETLAAGQNLEDAKVKNEIAAQVLPLIEDNPNPIERDTYRQRLARLIKVDERALLERGAGGRARPASRRRATQPAPVATPAVTPVVAPASSFTQEMHCLGVLLRRPDLVYLVDRRLQQEDLTRLTPQDFRHADHQAILKLIQESVDQDIAEPIDFILNNLSLSMMELVDSLLAQTEKLDPRNERVVEDLMRSLLDLRQRVLHEEIEYNRYLMQEAQEQGDIMASQYSQAMLKLVRLRERLDQAIKKTTSRAAPARPAG